MKAVSVEPDARLAELAGGQPSWQDAARVPTRVGADALAWARATFEGAPLLLRVFLLSGWVLLLLPGGARSDETHVLGWPVAQTTETTAVLQRTSRLGIRATLLFSTDAGGVTFSSAMVFEKRLGRVVWFAVAPVHRWVVRVSLGGARIRERGGSVGPSRSR